MTARGNALPSLPQSALNGQAACLRARPLTIGDPEWRQAYRSSAADDWEDWLSLLVLRRAVLLKRLYGGYSLDSRGVSYRPRNVLAKYKTAHAVQREATRGDLLAYCQTQRTTDQPDADRICAAIMQDDSWEWWAGETIGESYITVMLIDLVPYNRLAEALATRRRTIFEVGVLIAEGQYQSHQQVTLMIDGKPVIDDLDGKPALIDEALVDAIRYFNTNGHPTRNCCQGGWELDKYRCDQTAYIMFSQQPPRSLIQLLDDTKFEYYQSNRSIYAEPYCAETDLPIEYQPRALRAQTNRTFCAIVHQWIDDERARRAQRSPK